MVLTDLRKFFDSICHWSLPQKLRHLGTSSQALKWLESYLTCRMQSTRAGTSPSDQLTVTYGMPQRSILGRALLFSLYMISLTQPSLAAWNLMWMIQRFFCPSRLSMLTSLWKESLKTSAMLPRGAAQINC